MAIAEVGRRYGREQDVIGAIADRIDDILRGYCGERGYPFVGREKIVASLGEKIESGRYAAWSELDDLYACSVVIPTLKHESGVLAFLRSTFVEVTTKLRSSTEKSPDVFRFEATRFIGTLRAPPGISTEERLYTAKFEVQVRTAFEHAWSAATHSLVYKSGTVDWKRMRMAAQIKAAVEQLDTLVLAFESSAELVTEHRSPDVTMRAGVIARLKPFVDTGIIPRDQEPKDWSRFADNFVALVRAGSRVRWREMPSRVDAALDLVAAELEEARIPYPRSVSLLQFVLGALAEADWLELPLERFAAVITQEVTDVFPAAKNVTPIFEFEQ